jgi:hypothetical protein
MTERLVKDKNLFMFDANFFGTFFNKFSFERNNSLIFR